MPYGLIAVVGFWGLVIRLWISDGAKIPLIVIGLWAAGYFGFPRLHWSGLVFLTYECALAVALLLIELYKRERSKTADVWLETKK